MTQEEVNVEAEDLHQTMCVSTARKQAIGKCRELVQSERRHADRICLFDSGHAEVSRALTKNFEEAHRVELPSRPIRPLLWL